MTTIASFCHVDVQQKLFEGPAAIKKELIRTFFSIALVQIYSVQARLNGEFIVLYGYAKGNGK